MVSYGVYQISDGKKNPFEFWYTVSLGLSIDFKAIFQFISIIFGAEVCTSVGNK